MHPAHPLAVTSGEIVVDRHHVHALAGQCVEVGRQDAGQRLALAGLHLGDVAEVQRRATHDLHVEVALGQHPPGRLASYREGLRQEVVELLAAGHPLAELVGLGPQFGVGELLYVVGQGVDIVSHPPQAFDHAAFTDAQQLRQHVFPLNDDLAASPFREA